MNEPFTQIYNLGGWSGMGSGPGSSRSYNRSFLRFLTEFMQLNDVRSMVDFGCGDWQMFNRFDFKDVQYLGLDVVDSVIRHNKQKHGKTGIEFQTYTLIDSLDIRGDLFLAKDVLQHLPNEQCSEILNFASDRFRYIVAVNDSGGGLGTENHDIHVGGYRPLDLSRQPFNRQMATVHRYGTETTLVRDFTSLTDLIVGRHIPTGIKHVQLEVSAAGNSFTSSN